MDYELISILIKYLTPEPQYRLVSKTWNDMCKELRYVIKNPVNVDWISEKWKVVFHKKGGIKVDLVADEIVLKGKIDITYSDITAKKVIIDGKMRIYKSEVKCSELILKGNKLYPPEEEDICITCNKLVLHTPGNGLEYVDLSAVTHLIVALENRISIPTCPNLEKLEIHYKYPNREVAQHIQQLFPHAILKEHDVVYMEYGVKKGRDYVVYGWTYNRKKIKAMLMNAAYRYKDYWHMFSTLVPRDKSSVTLVFGETTFAARVRLSNGPPSMRPEMDKLRYLQLSRWIDKAMADFMEEHVYVR